MIFLLTSCANLKTATTGKNISPRVNCEVFLPITWDTKDSEQTREQIIEHNAVWDALCLGEP